MGSSLRPVAANDNQRIDVMLVKCPQCFKAPVLSLEFGRTAAAQYRSALLDDTTNVSGTQWQYVIGDKADIAVTNAEDIPSLVQTSPHHGSDSSIHAGSVTSAGQHCDTFHVTPLLPRVYGQTKEYVDSVAKSLLLPGVTAIMISTRFPKSLFIFCHKLNPLHPLGTFPEIKSGNHQPYRIAMLRS